MILQQVRSLHFCWDKHKYAIIFMTSFTITSAYNQPPICNFGQDVILCSQSIDMGLHLVKNVTSPVNKLDADNKAYVDRIKHKTATAIIPNTIMIDNTIFTFAAAKVFASGKIIICEMWVEELRDEWIATSSLMFTTVWPGFHKFSTGPSRMTFVNSSPPVVGQPIFASTI